LIYACVNTKGGGGKTTTAVHLAVRLAVDGPTLLIDGDPQKSAAAWAAWRRESPYQDGPTPTTTCLNGRAITTEGRELAAGFKNTVVDAGGRDSAGLRAALILAHQAIVPVGASNFDSAAMTDLLEVVELAKDYTPSLTVRVLLSRVDMRSKDVGEMLENLRESKLQVFKTRICERVAFRRAIGEGATAGELNKDPLATAEMEALYEEVLAG